MFSHTSQLKLSSALVEIMNDAKRGYPRAKV